MQCALSGAASNKQLMCILRWSSYYRRHARKYTDLSQHIDQLQYSKTNKTGMYFIVPFFIFFTLSRFFITKHLNISKENVKRETFLSRFFRILEFISYLKLLS